MKASQVMTRHVIAVAPDTPVGEVAKLMVDQRISGMPVMDHGKLVGIISENDLVRRIELGTDKTRSGWLQFFTSEDTVLAEYVRARGKVARDAVPPDIQGGLRECDARLGAQCLEEPRGWTEASYARLDHVCTNESGEQQPPWADQPDQQGAEQSHEAGEEQDCTIGCHVRHS
jgi:hypothetical protein